MMPLWISTSWSAIIFRVIVFSGEEQLLNKKSEHKEEMKLTVDEKLTSWTDVVKKNNEQQQHSISLTEKDVRLAVKSAIQDSGRTGIVVTFNKKLKEEKEAGTSVEDYDKAPVKELFYRLLELLLVVDWTVNMLVSQKSTNPDQWRSKLEM